MLAHCSLLSSLMLASLLAVVPRPAGAQEPKSSAPGTPLSVEEVVKLSQAGFSEEVIITKIKKK